MKNEQPLGDVITSKGMVLMSPARSDEAAPVRLGQRITWEGATFFVIGGTSPQYPGASGRVYLKNTDTGHKLEVRTPGVNMTWRAA